MALMTFWQAGLIGVCCKLFIRFFCDGSFTLGNIFKRFLVVTHIRIIGNDGHKAV